MPDESDRIELALLLIQQLTDRVEELEARGADQKMSLGDTIVRLRRRVHILERGADTTATAASSRGVGGEIIMLPILLWTGETTSHTPRWTPVTTCRVPRLIELEVAALNPGGDVDKIQARLRDLEERQAGHAASMG